MLCAKSGWYWSSGSVEDFCQWIFTISLEPVHGPGPIESYGAKALICMEGFVKYMKIHLVIFFSNNRNKPWGWCRFVIGQTGFIKRYQGTIFFLQIPNLSSIM